MPKMIPCPFHTQANGAPERTPSFALYETRYYCFGCRASGPVADLGAEYRGSKTTQPEDIVASLRRISDLPKQQVRGFQLPADEMYWYLVWPSGRYYVRRRHETKPGQQKYLSPKGHARPTYIPRKAETGTLWFVEGELNALSLAQVVSDTVASPGSAGAFAKKNWTLFRRFSRVIVVADDDAAGADAAYLLAERLVKDMKKEVIIQLWAKDANQILVEEGTDGLQQEVERRLREAKPTA